MNIILHIFSRVYRAQSAVWFGCNGALKMTVDFPVCRNGRIIHRPARGRARQHFMTYGCCHGDGGHVCSKYHCCTHYYQASMLVAINSFVVAVVMGGMCVQSITAIRTTISNLYWLLCL